MISPRSMFEKIWESHVVTTGPGGRALLYVDRLLLHDGSGAAFERLARRGLTVRRPAQALATADHYVPTVGRAGGIADPAVQAMVDRLQHHTTQQGIGYLGPADSRQGIVHVIGPEQGFTEPGLVLVCGDSHTATHGAFGCLAAGIGSSEVEHVLATQCLWQRHPKVMRVIVDGPRAFGVHAKDVILAVIAAVGAGGGTGHAIEYAGSTIRSMSMDERMTVCNMSIEAGARAGMVAPDETTYAYVQGRPWAPKDDRWQQALAYWKTLPSDAGAVFDREVALDGAAIAPMVTWGTSPETALPVTERVPDPAAAPDPGRRASMERMLAYMGLAARDSTVRHPGRPCLHRFLHEQSARRPPRCRRGGAQPSRARAGTGGAGLGLVKAAAEREGLDRVFLEAGFEWREPGCSMCVGMNGDLGRPGERIASTSNRNFEGRQGKGVRTHLMSPAMAAAAAVTGAIADVRALAVH